MLRKIHDLGIKSDHMYLAGFASIALAIATWAVSMQKEKAGMDRADRWGIFVGEWAPTFIALGNGLRSYESQDVLSEQHEQFAQSAHPDTAVPSQAAKV
jgi:hypothetical protein